MFLIIAMIKISIAVAKKGIQTLTARSLMILSLTNKSRMQKLMST